jgi:mono/diheme cytochrome c family protein
VRTALVGSGPVRRLVLPVILLLALGVLAVGCGGEEEATPTPTTVEGTLPQTTTEGGGGSTLKGDPQAGKQVFASAGCGGCHTLSDAGTNGTVGPNLDDAKPPEELVVERVTNGRGAMPSFKGQLTEQQIADVAAYVSSAAGS